MNATEQKFNEIISSLETLKTTSPQSIKRSKEFQEYAGRRSNTCFKKVYRVLDIGERIGELTITGYVVGAAGGLKSFIVTCSCGSPEFTVNAGNIHSGKSTRCMMCGNKKTNTSRKKYWGYVDILADDNHRYRLLSRISAAITRCGNPNDKNYHNYGGRGIKVFEPWRTGTDGRKGFLAHLITLDGWDIPELDMDRIDCDKGYEPGNIRFVTRSDNMYNKRKVSDLQAAYDELKSRSDYLEELVGELTGENGLLRDSLNNRDFGENWILKSLDDIP